MVCGALTMDVDEIANLLGEVPAHSALAAALCGLFGVLVLAYAVGCCGRSKGKKEVREEAKKSEDEGPEVAAKAHKQAKNKGAKPKQSSSKSKVVLPPHPLLAAEFKGHTGSVVSMDFDVNGKYLATCSDGKDISGRAAEGVYAVYISV